MFTSVGFIGSGEGAGAFTPHLATAGMPVLISNSRGPASLTDTVTELGAHAHAHAVTEAATPVERVVMARSCHSVAIWPLVLRPDPRYERRRPGNGNGQRRVREGGKLVQFGGPLSALHVLKQD